MAYKSSKKRVPDKRLSTTTAAVLLFNVAVIRHLGDWHIQLGGWLITLVLIFVMVRFGKPHPPNQPDNGEST